MKKILIVIHDMEIGGAQKSLLAFLQCLMFSDLGSNYDVHLMTIKPSGAFYTQIPKNVKVILPPEELRWLGTPVCKQLFKEHFSWRGFLGKLCWVLRNKCKTVSSKLSLQQRLWECWKTFIPKVSEKYDIAISYMDGVPNYYVMTKVQAEKKVLWIHNEYQKQGYNARYDEAFFRNSDAIITISEKCKSCLLEEFPKYIKKIHVLENITVYKELLRKSKQFSPEEYKNEKALKILSVGRLNEQKGFDIAIKAAKILKERGLKFLWIVLGEGTERLKLQSMIDEYSLNDSFLLIGVRDNPYVYMRECDVLVQSSRYEGKSLVIDEAKILCKPIVATNYATVQDTIEHGKTGWIVELNEKELAEGILNICTNAELRNKLIMQLQMVPKGNEEELIRYIKIMF